MTNRSKLASLVGLAVALFFAETGATAAELQECFRDGYLCSIKCDKARLDNTASAACQARCNADEKLCVSDIAARRPSGVPYSPATASVRFKPLKAVQQAAR